MPSVFSFSEEEKKKKKLVEKSIGVVSPTHFSSQHGAVDLDYIPLISSLDFLLFL